jgi:type IV pilus assembly protein PilC
MTTFAYTAFDSRGKLFRGDIKERSWTQALRRVKEMGLFPTSVKERPRRLLGGKIKTGRRPAEGVRHAGRSGVFGSRVSGGVITAFTRQLATLIDAGIPLIRGLRSIQEQEENKRLRAIVGELVKEIEGGSTLSEALDRHPRVFSRLYVKMVVAGEAAGTMDSTLMRLAEFMERALKIGRRIKGALVYPAAVLFVAVGILSALSVFVIPRFKALLADLTGRAQLPAFTEFVLNSSQWIKDHLLVMAGGLTAVVLAYRWVNATGAGRAAIDRFKLKLPVVGKIMRRAAIARLARTLGAMLKSGVPMLQALTIVRETASNMVFAQALQQTHDRVKEGDTLTSPLQRSGVFPATVISMIDVGEQTGALPEMLLRVADNYDEEVDNSIAAAMSLLEPALIIFLAVIVGIVVIALFLPIIPGGSGSGDGMGL